VGEVGKINLVCVDDVRGQVLVPEKGKG
jgi:hypothetical protein